MLEYTVKRESPFAFFFNTEIGMANQKQQQS